MLTAQKKTFSLAGMSPKSSNMTAKSGINTADTSKAYHFMVVGADALTMSEITVDGVSVEKVSGCAREFLVVDDLLCSRSDSTKIFVRTRDVNEMSAMYCASGSSNSEFSESIKKSLPLCGNTVYGYKAPHKTGAGIRTPQAIEAIHDAPASFFVSAHTHTLSMVGCMGLTSVRLVSLIASSPNPVQSTASELRTSGGGYKPSIKEAATCWLLPLPKNRNLSGLSPQFAAIARQLPPKFI
ncbi:ash family protein, partial [Escherichia coli]|uniref:ash family protein n=1 Tax=Escherichia coli TaxID=562 RepID=UPI002148D920